MTEEMGVAKTKQRFAELIGRVLDGERFVVTRRGRPVASLVPVLYEAESGGERTYGERTYPCRGPVRNRDRCG